LSGLLFIDLSSGSIRKEGTSQHLLREYLGGDGLATRLFTKRMIPGMDAFDPRNVLVLAPGLFNGLPIPTSGKTVFLSKSPLTGTISESAMGGAIGSELKQAGYDAVVVEGKAASPMLILIDDDEVILEDASEYWGMFTRDASKAIRRREGDFCAATIGPAGERLVRFAGIDCEDRQAGRGGLGAVMGSKNLKALAVRGTGDLPVHRPREMERLALEWQDTMVKSAAFRDDTVYGTGEFLEWLNSERGVFPTRNWQESVFKDRKDIDPHSWAPKYSGRNKGCFSCTKACGKLFQVKEGRYAGTVLDGIEYETLYSLGSQCSNPDVEAVAKANELCDQFGMDTISTGVVIGFVMELVERDILSVEDVGVECRFGNSPAVPEMVDLIGRREGLGRILGEGVMRASSIIGKGSDRYAMHVRGMEPPAYDVRGMKGLALAFMTSPRGACHLRSGAYALELLGKAWRYTSGRHSAEGKGESVKGLEDLMTVYDSLGLCKFSRRFFWAETLPQMIQVALGWDYGVDTILLTGERTNNLKQLFNLKAGSTEETAYLPTRLRKEPIKEGASQGQLVSDEEMHAMLSDYYHHRGWDDHGAPTVEKLRQLGIAH